MKNALKTMLLAGSNSAELALGTAVTGVILTGVLAGRASLKADDILAELEEQRYNIGIDEPLTVPEKLEATWKCYILPTVAAGATIFLMIWSHRIQGRKLIALASAYSITDSAFREYRNKVQEMVSKKKFDEIDHAIDQDKTSNFSVLDGDILATNRGDVLCLDAWSGQKFFSNKTAIEEAVARANALMVGDIYMPLNTLYDEMGIPPSEGGEELGWNALVDKSVKVRFGSTLDKENIPTLVMHLDPAPRYMYKDV